MARKRMIDPSIWQDKDFGKMSPNAQVLFIACISNADDDGYLLANATYLRSIAYLYHKTSDAKAKSFRDEMVAAMSKVHCFQSDGEDYIHFVTWEKYQNQRDDRRVTSRIPRCPQCDVKMSSTSQTDDGQSAAEVKLSKDKLREVKLSKVTLREGSVKGGGMSAEDGGVVLQNVPF
jgi:hypothetical protein